MWPSPVRMAWRAAALAPRVALAGVPESRRCFLFLHCRGGWDPLVSLLPAFDAGDTDADAVPAEAGGVAFVDHPERPSVRAFFEQHGSRTCMVHGIEVRSIAHERCHRLILTGRGDAGADDWPSLLAANAEERLLLPHLLLAGGAFNRQHGDVVVRVGDVGNSPAVVRCGARPVGHHRPRASGCITDVLARRTWSKARAPFRNPAERRPKGLRRRLPRCSRWGGGSRSASQGLELAPRISGVADIVADAATAFDCFERGLSRCAILAYDGWCAEGWDTHKDNTSQSRNFEDLFGYLSGVVAELTAARDSREGRSPTTSPSSSS